MNSSTPKQFLTVKGFPILMHTITAFYKYSKNINIIVAVPKDKFIEWKELCKKHRFNIKHKIVEGGKNRFHSVKNGISAIHDGEAYVAIHDGVRPFISKNLISELFIHLEKYGNVIPVITVNQSIREIKRNKNYCFDRQRIRIVQTPQCFKLTTLKKAYKQNYKQSFTDDATVVESIGEKINLIEGEETNIKITTPLDLKLAELIANFK